MCVDTGKTSKRSTWTVKRSAAYIGVGGIAAIKEKQCLLRVVFSINPD